MTLLDLTKTDFGLNQLEQSVLELTLANELNVDSKRVTNKQIATTLNTSEANVKRIKAKTAFQDARLALSKDKGKQLLSKAVRELEKILDDPKASGTTKIKAIQTVYQSVGMTKAPDAKAATSTDTSKVDIDALLKHYNIRKAGTPVEAEHADPEGLSEPQDD